MLLPPTPHDESARIAALHALNILDTQSENALKDERFNDNPVVVGEPKIRFYAGCSLNVNGFKMGTFCVFDKQPSAFTSEDRQLLTDLAVLAERELAISPPMTPS